MDVSNLTHKSNLGVTETSSWEIMYATSSNSVHVLLLCYLKGNVRAQSLQNRQVLQQSSDRIANTQRLAAESRREPLPRARARPHLCCVYRGHWRECHVRFARSTRDHCSHRPKGFVLCSFTFCVCHMFVSQVRGVDANLSRSNKILNGMARR